MKKSTNTPFAEDDFCEYCYERTSTLEQLEYHFWKHKIEVLKEETEYWYVALAQLKKSDE